MANRNSPPRWRTVLIASGLALTAAFAMHDPAPRAQVLSNPGTSPNCDDFKLNFLHLLEFDITDEGWVWVEPDGRRFRSVSGLVTGSKVARNDLPANHDSHDHNTHVLVDLGQEDILSIANNNDPNDPRVIDTIELEWEIGVRPSEKTGDGANPTFPKWVWPSVGDRVWANGHWVFDCGHASEIGGQQRYRSEIHPPRAFAAMRDQAGPLPGTGGSAVPITATDLYIHGRGGFLVEQLYCGMSILITGTECEIEATPIAENFQFEMCLPPKPSSAATATWFFEDGPGNTVGVAPQIVEAPASAACQVGSTYDHSTMLQVTVPLDGTGVSPLDVYARRIYAGWVGGAQPPMRHLRVTLKQMDLHEDHELDPGDGEMTFFWMNVNRAADAEWIRLSDFADGNMNDYDDDGGLGDGEMDFTGATFDFYIRPNQDFTVRANGYEQDCYEEGFGSHQISIILYLNCHNPAGGTGNNDEMTPLPKASAPFSTTFGPFDIPPFGAGTMQDLAAGDYELEILIEEVPAADDAPPTTVAASPLQPPNANGWNNTDVTVALTATDNDGGSGVKEILFQATGAQTVPLTTVAGATASLTLTAEGVTTIDYQSRDNNGNLEPLRSLVVRIDKTPPVVTVNRTPPPNVNGWNNTDVVARFEASDTLSGIDGPSVLDVLFSTEGTNQGATRSFADLAGNSASATISGINIDKTPPTISGLPANCELWPADHLMIRVGTAVIADALSGLAPGSTAFSAASNEPANDLGDGDVAPDILIVGNDISFRRERSGRGSGRLYTVNASAQDLAGNTGTATGGCFVPRNR